MANTRQEKIRGTMKLICTNPLYKIKTSIFSFLVDWNKVIDLKTHVVYYEAKGIINRFLAKIIYKKFIISEEECKEDLEQMNSHYTYTATMVDENGKI